MRFLIGFGVVAWGLRYWCSGFNEECRVQDPKKKVLHLSMFLCMKGPGRGPASSLGGDIGDGENRIRAGTYDTSHAWNKP